MALNVGRSSGIAGAVSNTASTNAPTIRWINHASFVLESDGVAILADPWLTGPAFNFGWSLLTPSSMSDFDGITHIWISHQHPDHFSPRDLRGIPAERKRDITLLYQQTRDRLVVGSCKSMGFERIVELPKRRWIALSPQLSIMTDSIADDSWIAYKTPSGTVLNLNDCVVEDQRTLNTIHRLVGPLEVLLTQFSYANWVGNPEDFELRQGAARIRLDTFIAQVQALRPRYVVPFASFIYFANEENWHFNDSMNTVDRAVARIQEETTATPVVLYPGDVWQYGREHDNAPALERYAADLRSRMEEGPRYRLNGCSADAIHNALAAFYSRLWRRVSRPLRFYPLATTVYVCDLDLTVQMSLREYSVSEGSPPDGAADIETSSENLLYALKTPWGGDALHVNGRFRARNFARYKRFFNLCRVADIATRPGSSMTWFLMRAWPGVLRSLAFSLMARFRRRVS